MRRKNYFLGFSWDFGEKNYKTSKNVRSLKKICKNGKMMGFWGKKIKKLSPFREKRLRSLEMGKNKKIMIESPKKPSF